MSRSGFGFRVSCVRVRGVVRGYSGLGWSEVCGVWCVVLARLWRVYIDRVRLNHQTLKTL